MPRNHGTTITCIAALTPTGIRAPLVVAGALDGALFVQWRRDRLLPTLAPGTTIVLDTLSVHRTAAARAAIAAAGCRVRFPPAYSPDVNPVPGCPFRHNPAPRSAGNGLHSYAAGILADSMTSGRDARGDRDRSLTFDRDRSRCCNVMEREINRLKQWRWSTTRSETRGATYRPSSRCGPPLPLSMNWRD